MKAITRLFTFSLLLLLGVHLLPQSLAPIEPFSSAKNERTITRQPTTPSQTLASERSGTENTLLLLCIREAKLLAKEPLCQIPANADFFFAFPIITAPVTLADSSYRGAKIEVLAARPHPPTA